VCQYLATKDLVDSS